MAYSPSSPVTGATQTGFTTPTYTLSADTAPDSNGKQHAVTALGGTQTGVTAHSVASPFTLTFVRPKQLRTLGVPAANGFIGAVPNNIYRQITRKGVVPAVGQPARTMMIETIIHVPAGSDTYDAANVKAALSAHIGILNQQSAGIGDTTLNGVF